MCLEVRVGIVLLQIEQHTLQAASCSGCCLGEQSEKGIVCFKGNAVCLVV